MMTAGTLPFLLPLCADTHAWRHMQLAVGRDVETAEKPEQRFPFGLP